MSTAVKQHFSGVYKCLGREVDWIVGERREVFQASLIFRAVFRQLDCRYDGGRGRLIATGHAGAGDCSGGG